MSRTPFRVVSPPPKPLLVFDGECGFCRAWVAHWKAATGGRVDYAPSQEVAARFPEIPPESFQRAAQFIGTDGAVCEGAEAVFRALAYAPYQAWPLWLYRRAPGVAAVSEFFYGIVARNRGFFSLLTRWLWGASVEPPTWFVSRWLFLRLLGVIYLIAFVSFWVQVDGLIGSRGIVPAADFLGAVRQQTGAERFWNIPTLCWLNASDGFLHGLCAAGSVLSAMLICGLAPVPCLICLWAVYLSLCSVSSPFLNFQWDVLLLEAGFLAIFFAPLKLRHGPVFPLPHGRGSDTSVEPRPSRIARLLLCWLLFRLIFSSGVVKLASGDPVWRDLTALNYHYETQPLPTWTAWYLHQAPEWFQKTSTVIMFFVELVVPFFIFAPRRLRLAACAALAGLQILLIATGNYAFFNLLSVALCVPLIDDASFPRWLQARLVPAPERIAPGRPRAALVFLPLALFIAALGAVQMLDRFNLRIPWRAVRWVDEQAAPLRAVNGYGLFADMTTERPEIVIEGSDDEETWLAYEFKWKPGDPNRAPAFVAPHQPRLDWQMWFAALSDVRYNRWVVGLMRRLLEGSPPVLDLLEKNPYPGKPPRFMRAIVYDYHFTDRAERAKTGAWWRREVRTVYMPSVSLPRRQ